MRRLPRPSPERDPARPSTAHAAPGQCDTLGRRSAASRLPRRLGHPHIGSACSAKPISSWNSTAGIALPPARRSDTRVLLDVADERRATRARLANRSDRGLLPLSVRTRCGLPNAFGRSSRALQPAHRLARRHASGHPGQLEMRVGVDEAGEDDGSGFAARGSPFAFAVRPFGARQRRPTATIRPPSTSTHPSRIGGASMGRTHAARWTRRHLSAPSGGLSSRLRFARDS